MSKNHKKSHRKKQNSKSKKRTSQKSEDLKKKKRKKHPKKNKKKQQKKKVAFSKKELLIKIGIASLISLTVYVSLFMILFSAGRVKGYAMIPTLNDKDIVAVNRRKSLKRFDLVYINTPKRDNEKSVRRVIGIPGDEVSFKNDDLYINGEMKEEKYLASKKKMMKNMILTDDFSLMDISKENKVPSDKYLVLGDNRKSATDSRYYGLVSKQDIIGTVEYRIFPFSKFKAF